MLHDVSQGKHHSLIVSVLAEFIQIHQPALHVLKYETVELTCEIQYGVNVQDKLPFHFWFNDINNVNKNNLIKQMTFLIISLSSYNQYQIKQQNLFSIPKLKFSVEIHPLYFVVLKKIPNMNSFVFEHLNRAFLHAQLL